jgi:hypothetical protein
MAEQPKEKRLILIREYKAYATYTFPVKNDRRIAMRTLRYGLYAVLVCFVALIGIKKVFSETGNTQPSAAIDSSPEAVTSNNYVIIGWNDLGMHCISPRFSELSMLPPYNNLYVQVIKRGDPPTIVTTGIFLEYSIINNTTVVGKTDFWQYVEKLFGVALPTGVGLTGNKLKGYMKLHDTHFEVSGMPVLPYNDAMTWNPYQIALIKLKDKTTSALLATTRVVIPVSDEMHCDKCHAAGGVAAKGINTGTVEGNILTLHDNTHGTKLMASRPVLCAGCHSDNALGTPGKPGIPSMSLAIHGKHAILATLPDCYDCHPGKNTKCVRSAISAMGPVNRQPGCNRCHGGLKQVANSIKLGREPWLQEPGCSSAKCHDQSFSTGNNLYRNSTGHGGIYCSACHNSPHAWWPSLKAADNLQPINLQGEAGPIEICTVCHKTSPGGTGVHGSN